MEIEQIISTLGFPIAAFLLMFWQNTKVLGKFDTTIAANTAALEGVKDALLGVKIIAKR